MSLVNGRHLLIYGLRDPRSGEIRYVGKSTRGLQRALAHGEPNRLVSEAHTHKSRWIAGLKSAGLFYDVVVLQECTSDSELCDAEKRWIAIGYAANTITNATKGGDGTSGHRHSPKAIEKIAAALSRRVVSAETRARLSASMRGRRHEQTLEARVKISEALRGHIVSQETRKKLSDAAKRHWSEKRA